MDANQARPPQYLTLDGYHLAAATGNPDGKRIVTMVEAVPSDAGTPGNVDIIWDVDGAGMATERHRVDMGSLDMETAFPLALDNQRVVFATAYWAPTGEEGARRVLMLNLDTGEVIEQSHTEQALLNELEVLRRQVELLSDSKDTQEKPRLSDISALQNL